MDINTHIDLKGHKCDSSSMRETEEKEGVEGQKGGRGREMRGKRKLTEEGGMEGG